MQALYRADERTGPFRVVSDDLVRLPDGRYLETMIDSGDNRTFMFRLDEDASYRPVFHPKRRGGVLIPFTRLDPRTVNNAPKGAEWVDVSASSFDYWRVLCDYWEPSFDLSVCEHDVVWREDVSESFERCPEPWCVFAYHDHCPEEAEAWNNMLGCTRFRVELIRSVPNAVRGIEERWRDWHYLCNGLGTNLRAEGFTQHWHFPPVRHHHFR